VGLLAFVLERASVEANGLGYTTIILQVAAESDAERVYWPRRMKPDCGREQRRLLKA